MCFSAIPGQNHGIRAIRDLAGAVTSPPKSEPCVSIKPVETIQRPAAESRKPIRTEMIRVASGLREPISHERIPYAWSRRNHRTDNERGKRTAKRMHKPCWRGYEKF